MQMLKHCLNYGILLSTVLFISCSPKFTEEAKEGFNLVHNEDGETLGYSTDSEISILTIDRLAFKDLNKNGTLDPYEDWRLTAEERANDLASKMSVEQIAGLMLYSAHQSIPGEATAFLDQLLIMENLMLKVALNQATYRMHRRNSLKRII